MSLILDGTSGLSDVDGTAGTPAIRGSDANTGVFFGTDIVGVSTGGSERMRVDASGNVGIGTSSPDNKLEIALADNQGINLEQTGAGQTGFINWRDSDGTLSGRISYDHGSDALRFNTAATERARIDSSGNLLVGTTSYVSGEARLTVVNKAGNANNSVVNLKANATTISTTMLGFYDGTDAFCGQAYIDPNSNTTVFATSSDYRLKENVAPMTGALERVSLLKPCTYTWKKSGRVGEGFIAHELADVCPAAVVGEKDAVTENGGINPQMIDTSFLVATLTAAIQELKAINDAQAQIIESLTARVAALEGQA